MRLQSIILLITLPVFLWAQTFTKVTDDSNPVVSANYPGNYSGTAFIDFDNDGVLDLYNTNTFLFRGLGGGDFEQLNTVIGSNINIQLGNGTSWADADNDGDLDCFYAGNPSLVYLNNGDGTFTESTGGDLNRDVDNRGWTGAWGDYDNDGFVDVVIAHPAGFIGLPTPSHLLHNDGDGRFTKVDTFHFTQNTAPYTVATWNDFDLDGDIDLFIGSGPAGTSAPDNIYRNMLQETGTADLVRITDLPFATDEQDGQTWNWVDYDNDGDLDGFITNYGGAPNRFYVNENGTYNSVQNAMTIAGNHLANSWGDLDNDGDLDVIISSESGNLYFRNDDGTFVSASAAFVKTGATRGVTLGDVDNDGDLDVFISGGGDGAGYYLNESGNSNNWLIVSLEGTVSNKAAIGAKVRVRAQIGDETVWQMREISAQNSFNSHNSLRAHFGLAQTSTVDSLIVEWPSGQKTEMGELSANQFLSIREEVPAGFLRANFRADNVTGPDTLTVQFEDLSIADPDQPVVSYAWDFNEDGITDSEEQNPSYGFNDDDSLYSVTLTVRTATDSMTFTRENYIRMTGALPDIQMSEAGFSFGRILNDVAEVDTSFYVYNSGTAPDTLTAYLTNIRSETDSSGQKVEPEMFVVAPMDSHEVTFTFYPPQLSIGLHRTEIIIEARNNPEQQMWAKRMTFNIALASSIGDDTQKPLRFALQGNYPNPFNPSTRIAFSLAARSDVELAVYNSAGQKIRTLIRNPMNAGEHHVTWDGRNEKGEAVASGLYFYRIRAGAFVATRKMVLIR